MKGKNKERRERRSEEYTGKREKKENIRYTMEKMKKKMKNRKIENYISKERTEWHEER